MLWARDLYRTGAVRDRRCGHFFNNTGMVISITLALPLLVSTFPLDQMMTMFVVGGMNMPVAPRIIFTQGISTVFFISCIQTEPATIVSALRGADQPVGTEE